MGKFGNSAEALIEILNLCEQTLTALKADYDEAQAEHNRRQERLRSAKLVRQLFLIKGGLYGTDQQVSVR
jgi:hypothetical protein